MRPEALYLTDIVEAADAIAGFVKDLTKEAFVASDLFRSAVLQKPTIIGEAAARLNRQFKNEHPLVPWAEIVAFRNFAVHAYFGHGSESGDRHHGRPEKGVGDPTAQVPDPFFRAG